MSAGHGTSCPDYSPLSLHDALPISFKCLTFQLKRLAVICVIIAGGTAQAEHGIGLFELKVLAAQQRPIFIGLKVREAHYRRMGIARRRDFSDTGGQFIDKVL